MSEDEDTSILLKCSNHNSNISTLKLPIKEYECVLSKKLKKSISRNKENLTPLTNKNNNFLVLIVATLSGISFGYDIGIGKQIAPILQTEFGLNCKEENLITNVWIIGCLFGAIFSGILIDIYGRRWTMISSLIFLTFGSLLSALANHYILFLVARIISGCSGTVSAMAHCIYLAEISNSNKRGCNITLHQLGVAIGLLFSIIATVNKNEEYQWRFTIGIIAVFSMISCIIIIVFLQRSPSYLLLKRIANVHKIQIKYSWCHVLETFIIMVIMLSLREGTGRYQILYYAPRFFTLLGICSSNAKVTAMIALGVVRIFSTLLCLIIIEKCGRRTALITSATICMTSVSLLSLLATLDKGDELLILSKEPYNIIMNKNIGDECFNKIKSFSSIDSTSSFPLLPTPLAVSAVNTESWIQVKELCETGNLITSDGFTAGLKTLALITLLVFESAYALGLGPVPLLTLSEVFPAIIRGKCVGFSIIFLWIIHILLSESIGKVTRLMSLAGTFLFYTFMCLITIVYVFLTYPETKAKSLNQIAQELSKISIVTRICNNMRSLSTICHVQQILKRSEKKNKSTPI